MGFIRKMNERAVMERGETLAAKVLQGIFRAYYLPDSKALEKHDGLRMQIAHITRQTNFIINRENAEADLGDNEAFEAKKQLSAHFVGRIIRNELNLETMRATVGGRSRILAWEENNSRLNALMVRYGLDDYVMEMAQKGAKREKERAEKAEMGQGELAL